jgi:deazaflavin-dependent oxidoreductase (nitroreductase family)
MKLQRLYNPLVHRLLGSPLHRVMCNSTLLLTYTGRRSGRAYSLPVNYVRDSDTLLAVGARDHSWWRNLRGGVPVTLRLQGRLHRGCATAFEGESAVAEGGLLTLLRRVPQYRAHWGAALDADGDPVDPRALARIAAGNVLVRIDSLQPSA